MGIRKERDSIRKGEVTDLVDHKSVRGCIEKVAQVRSRRSNLASWSPAIVVWSLGRNFIQQFLGDPWRVARFQTNQRHTSVF
jgi:hypothetical protein